MAAIVPDPANTRAQSSPLEFGLGRFTAAAGLRAGLRENLRDLLKPSSRVAIRSGLLVAWESRPANFRRNLRDAIVAPFVNPLVSGEENDAVPEIWSKRTLLKRVQSLSLSYHVVLLAFIVAPFLPELMAPPTTLAKGGPWVRTRLVAPADIAKAIASITAKGGGSGGERNPIPETKGHVPPFHHIQLAPPSARPPQNPAMSVPPTLIGPQELRLQSPPMPNWGNPASPFTNDSSGPGQGGGIGDRTGGGIGDNGKGPGLGPGEHGGTGGSDYNGGARVSAYPVCIYCPNPQYSQEAVKSKFQGVVLLSATITADGRVINIRVVKGLGGGLDEMAVATVRTWRFRPALGEDHQPAAIDAPIEVTFRLY